MGFFDEYFESQLFEPGGGLVGRLKALQQDQTTHQPGWPQAGSPVGPQPVLAQATPQTPTVPPKQYPGNDVPVPMPRPPEIPPRSVAIGDYLMPQFGAGPVQPDFSDRVGAGFRSWAYTPVGNPFAALANAITGFNTGQLAAAPATRSPANPAQTQDDLASPAALAMRTSMPVRPIVRPLARRNPIPRP